MLASHVKSSEATPVLDVDIGIVVTQQSHCPAPASLSCQVESCHSVKLVLMVHSSAGIQQYPHNVKMTASCCHLQG